MANYSSILVLDHTLHISSVAGRRTSQRSSKAVVGNACCDIFASFLHDVEGARFRCEYII